MSAGELTPADMKKITRVVREWVSENRKAFWKYEVSCFYRTYVIRISNLPEPSADDIFLLHNSRAIDERKKKNLSQAIKKSVPCKVNNHIQDTDFQVDCNDGIVAVEVLSHN